MATKKKPAPASKKKAAPKVTAKDPREEILRKLVDPVPHADSPVLADAVPEGAPAATIIETPTGVVLEIEAETPATHPFLADGVFEIDARPPCLICGGEMKANVCPADGYHFVDAP